MSGTRRTSLIVDPPDGRIPALTPEAQSRLAERAAARRQHPADGPEDRTLAERCLMFNAGPPLIPGPYNNYVQLMQFTDYVVIFNEMIHDARIVPLDGRPHAARAIRRWLGDSRGRWIRDTLVVDTTNFTETTSFRGASEHLHVVERFTRVDASTLLYEFTIDDPTTFTKPWERRAANDEDERSDPRIRLPRSQLRDDRHPAWRARGRAGQVDPFACSGVESTTRATSRLELPSVNPRMSSTRSGAPGSPGLGGTLKARGRAS